MPKEKIWNIKSRENTAEIRSIADALGVGLPTAALLCGRGYDTEKKAKAFISLESELFYDPFLMKDMDKAVKRICRAVENGEKTVIYGDYDVDGITSVSLMYLYLKSKGLPVSYYIPNRVGEGYGVSSEAVKKLALSGNTLMITVDTGVTAIDEIHYAKELGMDTVITDHHECREILPDACAVINPCRADGTYPFKELAGVGVAFKTVCAVEFYLRSQKGQKIDDALEQICASYIDLVALGTVADVMPLKDENRLIVSMGLNMMEKKTRCGLAALMSACDTSKASSKNKRMTSSVISYTLAPRINAACRIASASLSVELFLSQDRAEAQRIAEELCEINKLRQEEENKIAEQIKLRIENDEELKNSAVMVIEDDGWNHGVIGIVASKITEKYGKPSILISFEGENGKGSGRSIKGLNLVQGLDSCSHLLTKYGGHELAAGLSIEKKNLSAFKKEINEFASRCLGEKELEVCIDIDCELYADEISLKQAQELELLEPCGTGNPVPTFATFDMTVLDILSLGNQGRHSKIILQKDTVKTSAVLFGTSVSELPYTKGQRVDIAYRLGVNEYMGIKSEQVLLRDIRLSEKEKQDSLNSFNNYNGVVSGKIKPKSKWIPQRQDFVCVYLHLKRNCIDGREVSLKALLASLNTPALCSDGIDYVKLRLIIDILNEMGIIEAQVNGASVGNEALIIKIPHIEVKVDLEKSCIYKQLMKQ